MDLNQFIKKSHIKALEKFKMDSLMNFGRGYQCFMESAFTPGKARLPRRLKKATKKFMRYYHKSSMAIMPQAQFVCFNSKGQLIVCHTKYSVMSNKSQTNN